MAPGFKHQSFPNPIIIFKKILSFFKLKLEREHRFPPDPVFEDQVTGELSTLNFMTFMTNPQALDDVNEYFKILRKSD